MLMIRERSWEISAWNSKVSPDMIAILWEVGSERRLKLVIVNVKMKKQTLIAALM